MKRLERIIGYIMIVSMLVLGVMIAAMLSQIVSIAYTGYGWL